MKPRPAASCLLMVVTLMVASFGCAPGLSEVPTAGISEKSPAAVRVIEVQSEVGKTMPVAVLDESGHLRDARSATLQELQEHQATLRQAPIASSNLEDDEVLVVWSGSACDTKGRITIGPGAATIVFEPEPRPGCDAISVPRGVVLSFGGPILASNIKLAAVDAIIIAD